MSGVLHCAGGSGCEEVNWVRTIRPWAEQAEAPFRIVARKVHGAYGARHAGGADASAGRVPDNSPVPWLWQHRRCGGTYLPVAAYVLRGRWGVLRLASSPVRNIRTLPKGYDVALKGGVGVAERLSERGNALFHHAVLAVESRNVV